MTNQPGQRPAAELIAGMGWEEMPYDCVGMSRSRQVSDTRIIWSWLILVPWAANDSKPWIDGVEIIGGYEHDPNEVLRPPSAVAWSHTVRLYGLLAFGYMWGTGWAKADFDALSRIAVIIYRFLDGFDWTDRQTL